MTKSTTDIPILDDDAIQRLEIVMVSGDSQAMYEAANIENVRALCNTVRVLRAEIIDYEQTDLVPRSRYNAVDAEAREAREHTKQLAHRAAAEIESLQSQLEQVTKELSEEKRLRAELKQIAQIGIAEVSSVGTALGETALTDFRLRAIALCRDKAARYKALANDSLPNDQTGARLAASARTLEEFAAELENLK